MVDAYLLRPENLVVVAFVWILIGLLKTIFPNTMAHPVIVRLLPLLPMLLCTACLWLPGVGLYIDGTANRIMIGIVLGAMAANGHKIFNQTLLGDDRRIVS